MADTLGTRIMKLRGENETQQQLADALGVSRSLVKAWENDDRPVRSDGLVKLASHYGVSADYLLGLVGADNATNDEKLRMVSEYTGLSNRAAEILHGLIANKLNGVYPAGFTDKDFYTPKRLLSEFFDYNGQWFFASLVDISDAINMIHNGEVIPSTEEMRNVRESLQEKGIAALPASELSKLKAEAASVRFSDILQGIYYSFLYESKGQNNEE